MIITCYDVRVPKIIVIFIIFREIVLVNGENKSTRFKIVKIEKKIEHYEKSKTRSYHEYKKISSNHYQRVT